mmetsp:Transcript_60819/g.131960  ORF Transcript_60819/g.131960 Transcript_60819/m.131960 type:complete len:398 (+) Transcript_60819:224-1417(+)
MAKTSSLRKAAEPNRRVLFEKRRPSLVLNGGPHRRQPHVEKPLTDQKGCRDVLRFFVAAKLSPHLSSSGAEVLDGEESVGGEDHQVEPQRAARHDEEGAVTGVTLEDASHRVVRAVRRKLRLPLLSLACCCPVDRRHGPGHTESKEDVDGVAPCHVANRGVGIRVHDGCCLGCEGIWQGGAQRHEGDRCDLRQDAQGAADEVRHVPDDGGDEGDHQQGAAKAGPTTAEVDRWHEGKDDFPRQREDVHEVVELAWTVVLTVLDFSIVFLVIFLARHEDGIAELALPVGMPQFHHVPVHSARQAVDDILMRLVGFDLHVQDAAVSAAVGILVELGTVGRLGEVDVEGLHIIIPALRLDRHVDHGRLHSLLQDELPLGGLVVVTSHSRMVLCVVSATDCP